MKTVIGVGAGHEYGRKKSSVIQSRLNYINIGLLGLCTLIERYSHRNVMMFQGKDQAGDVFEDIEAAGIQIQKDCECVLLSIPSFYSIPWAARFCEMWRERSPAPILVGGRWVVDGHADWVRGKLKTVDKIVEGFGEAFYAEYFQFDSGREFDGKKHCFDTLDYTLLYNYQKYQPSIEVSRGCGAGCGFCLDARHRRLSNQPPMQIMQELARYDEIFRNDYSVYFEAPHFVFEKTWVDGLCKGTRRRSYMPQWRCTTRVESVPDDDCLEMLRNTGLKVLDIGLESASPVQLLRMNKTRHPDKYLAAAEGLLERCQRHDIWVKFNLLLYAGETHKTIEESMKWLLERKALIKGVSVSRLTYYQTRTPIDPFLNLGASIPEDESLEENGYVNLHLSPELLRDEASSLGYMISRRFANQRDYYDIKRISYFENGYTYADFLDDMKKCDPLDLPFSIENDPVSGKE